MNQREFYSKALLASLLIAAQLLNELHRLPDLENPIHEEGRPPQLTEIISTLAHRVAHAVSIQWVTQMQAWSELDQVEDRVVQDRVVPKSTVNMTNSDDTG
jgi:hypothetical protein